VRPRPHSSAAAPAYRGGDAAPIVERFSQASILAIANGSQLAADLRDIRENWNDVITARSVLDAFAERAGRRC
jgi:hypothetical protein